MKVSDIFTLGGGCGHDHGDGDHGYHGYHGYSSYGDYNNRHYGGGSYRRSGYSYGGGGRGRDREEFLEIAGIGIL